MHLSESESSATTEALLLRAAEFEARRRRVLRATGVFVLASVGGLGLAIVAHEFAPGLFEPSVKGFVAAFATTGVALGWSLRRHWRCPACEVRWDFNDVLGSAQWNHCAACGEPLRIAPLATSQQRGFVSRFAQDDVPREELLARFLRRRRRGMLAASAVAIAGIAALVLVQARGWGRLGEHTVVALFGGIVAAIALTCARCPRCRLGVIAGSARHCQRCGLLLRPDLSEAAQRRTGT